MGGSKWLCNRHGATITHHDLAMKLKSLLYCGILSEHFPSVRNASYSARLLKIMTGQVCLDQ